MNYYVNAEAEIVTPCEVLELDHVEVNAPFKGFKYYEIRVHDDVLDEDVELVAGEDCLVDSIKEGEDLLQYWRELRCAERHNAELFACACGYWD